MLAVCVDIQPQPVADAGGFDQPGVHAGVGLARRQGVAAGVAAGAGVGVDQVVAADVGGAEHAAVGGHELNDVVARGQAGEVVVAVGVGDFVGPDLHARQVVDAGEQAHGDAGHAAFAGVLQPVGVEVVEDFVADAGARADHAGVHAGVGLARRQGVAAGVAAGAGVGVDQVVAADVGGAEHAAVGGHELNDVVARGQAGEVVVAVGVGDFVGPDLHARQVVDAGEQAHGDAGHAAFAGVLQPVGVEVVEDFVADAGRCDLAEIVLDAVAARGEHDGADDVVDGGVAASGASRFLAVEVTHRLGLGHAVGARAQTGKLVEAGCVGHGGGADRVAQVVGAVQLDDHPGYGRLGIAHAVVAHVLVDVAGQLGWHRHGRQYASVDGGVVLARGERDDLALAGDEIDVGIAQVAAAVLYREHRARGFAEHHLVLRARSQSGELVEAVRPGDGGCRGVANAVDQSVGSAADQGHGLAADADFAGVLLAVAIDIQPQPVAQAGVLVEAGIDRAVVLTGCQHDHVRQKAVTVGAGSRIAVDLSRATGRVAERQGEPHLVGQRGCQPFEAVGTVGVGGGRGQNLVGTGEQPVAVQITHQINGGSGNAGLSGVLYAVGVQVVPDKIAKLRSSGFDDQRLLMDAVHQGIKHDTHDLAHVWHVAVMRQGQGRKRVDIGLIDGAEVRRFGVPVLTHQFPDRALHFAESDTWVCTGVVTEQPIDGVEIIAQGVEADRRPAVVQNPQLVGGINRRGVSTRNIDVCELVETPTVVKGARGRKQRIESRVRQNHDVEQTRLQSRPGVGNSDGDGRWLIHEYSPKSNIERRCPRDKRLGVKRNLGRDALSACGVHFLEQQAHRDRSTKSFAMKLIR